MAKNNLFLGMAAGSVGDVVFYRANGAQISRARNRNPKNPRTSAQAAQRAFFAPVARFFAPLAQVLETSFEGLSRSASYSQFLSENIKAARNNGWYVPKGAPFWPLPYTLSKGTLQPVQVTWINGAAKFHYSGSVDYGAPVASVGHLSRSMVAYGYKNGDQVTVISVHPDGVGGYYPAWLRFNLNIDAFEPAVDVLANSAVDIVFDQASGNWLIQDGVDDENPTIAAVAVIVSRYENGIWRRSTQQLVLTDEAIEDITGADAIRRAIDSYRDSAGVPVSDIYLNGGTASDSGARYVGSIDIGTSQPVASYLTSIGQGSFVVDAQGTTAMLLTVSGIGVSSGAVTEGAAVLLGVTYADDVPTGHFVGVNAIQGGVTYTSVAVTGAELLRSILPRTTAALDDDQYNVNTYNFLVANGIPESALSFQ